MAGLLFYLKMEKNIQMHQAVVPQQPIMKMELYAIYASMKDFSRFCRPGDEIEIHSDSGYCINIFTQWVKGWKKKGWKKGDGKPIQNLEIIKAIWNLMRDIEKECNLRFVKVLKDIPITD